MDASQIPFYRLCSQPSLLSPSPECARSQNKGMQPSKGQPKLLGFFHGTDPVSKLCCTERAKPVSSLFTWVQPEESSGAAKVLPGQCGIPFKVVHKNRIQGF